MRKTSNMRSLRKGDAFELGNDDFVVTGYPERLTHKPGFVKVPLQRIAGERPSRRTFKADQRVRLIPYV